MQLSLYKKIINVQNMYKYNKKYNEKRKILEMYRQSLYNVYIRLRKRIQNK